MEGFQKPEQFAAWQLAWELKQRIFAFTAAAPAARDRDFCQDIREAARSAPDNISEGFYRFNPPDFANFVRFARGSLGELFLYRLMLRPWLWLLSRTSNCRVFPWR